MSNQNVLDKLNELKEKQKEFDIQQKELLKQCQNIGSGNNQLRLIPLLLFFGLFSLFSVIFEGTLKHNFDVLEYIIFDNKNTENNICEKSDIIKTIKQIINLIKNEENYKVGNDDKRIIKVDSLLEIKDLVDELEDIGYIDEQKNVSIINKITNAPYNSEEFKEVRDFFMNEYKENIEFIKMCKIKKNRELREKSLYSIYGICGFKILLSILKKIPAIRKIILNNKLLKLSVKFSPLIGIIIAYYFFFFNNFYAFLYINKNKDLIKNKAEKRKEEHYKTQEEKKFFQSLTDDLLNDMPFYLLLSSFIILPLVLLSFMTDAT